MEKEKGNVFSEKVKKALQVKTLKKDQLLIILLAGVLLLVIAIPTGKTKQTEVVPEETAQQTEEKVADERSDAKQYEAILERRLEEALSFVEGVGNVKVMITLKSSGEQVVEKDRPYGRNSVTETDSTGGSRSTTEINNEEETVYHTNESGENIPYVVTELEPKIEGVVVIAQGGNNSLTASNITAAVQALFSIEAHKIKVMKMR